MSKMMSGSPILMGDNTIPGVKMHKEVRAVVGRIFSECRDFGLDFYPTVVEFVTYDEISELASYGGFPVRYPHWRFGMEFEELSRGYEYGMHRISEMVINCLFPTAPVLTTRGTVSAESVCVGDKVSIGHQTRNVVAVIRQPQSKTKKIRLRKGQELVCSLDHKWKVLTEVGPDWVKAKDLKTGDILLGTDSFGMPGWTTPLPWSMQNVWDTSFPSVQHCLKEIVAPAEMTLALAELLGVLIGDGSVGVQGAENNLAVSVGKDNRPYAEYIAGLFSIVLGVDATIQEKPNGLVVLLQSKAAVDFVNSIGIKKGCTYRDKRIPSSIWNSHPVFRAAFLKGLFDTDGYATDQLGMSCYNLDLANDVQIMLSEMGIQTVLETIPNGMGKCGNELFINVVEVRGQASLRKFKERIGFSISYKTQGLAHLSTRENCRGGGIEVPYIQERLLEWGEDQEITSYSCPSLGRSLNQMKKHRVGLNCLYSFMERADHVENRSPPSDLWRLAETPMFEVQEVTDGPVTETIDIALDHSAHDFVAYGLVTHNTNPCYIYCLDSNTLCDNIDVIAHALGHNDFFKNNVFFGATNTDMLNKMANHGMRIRKYMARWGKEEVTRFIDQILRLETLIDPTVTWKEKTIKDVVIRDERKYYDLERLRPEHRYMDDWVNPAERIAEEKEKIRKKELADHLDLFGDPVKNILGYLKNHAPLKPWQQDIISMLYEESIYFAPQRATKMLNEGWASYVDFNIMCRRGLCSLGQKDDGAGIIEYAKHKMLVLGGKYSQNPYKTGYELLMDIEERWNKGRFGTEYDDCTNMRERANWDTKAGLGLEKVYEVRKHYNDALLIAEFFTQEFCEKHEFYEYQWTPKGEKVVINKDFKSIKRKLMQRYTNGGLPDIRLVDPNHRGRGHFLMQHHHIGSPLYIPHLKETLTSLWRVWQNRIVLATVDDDEEVVWVCDEPFPESVKRMSRETYEKI